MLHLDHAYKKINNTFVDNTDDLHIVMSMYNLLEYSDNYSMTLRSLWNYYRDEIDDNANENNAANNRIKNNKTITSNFLNTRFQIINAKLYVPVLTLSINDNIKVFEKYKASKDLKDQFIRTNIDMK